MPAAGGDVQGLHALARVAPLDDQVEIRPFAVRRALAVGLGPIGPRRHAASSTARRAASSIVGSTRRFGGGAPAMLSRPSSALVPPNRTPIGCSLLICESASTISGAITP